MSGQDHVALGAHMYVYTASRDLVHSIWCLSWTSIVHDHFYGTIQQSEFMTKNHNQVFISFMKNHMVIIGTSSLDLISVQYVYSLNVLSVL